MRAAIRAAIFAVLVVTLWQFLTVHFNLDNNWTGLFVAGDKQRIPADLAPGAYIFKNSRGYDGQFYRYVAHDPLFRKGYASAIDAPRVRYSRILVPGLAYILAAGQAGWIDVSFMFVVSLSIFMGVYWSARYVALKGRNPAWGLIFMLLPGTLASFDRMLLDATLAALFAGFIYFTETESWRKTYVVSALALLTRETGMFLILGGAGVAWMRRQRRQALLFLTAALPALAWFLFVWSRTSPSQITRIISRPVVGLFTRLLVFRALPVSSGLLVLLRIIDVLSVLSLVASVVLVLRWAWQERATISPPLLAAAQLALLTIFLGHPRYLMDAYQYARPISPLVLYIMLRGITTGPRWVAAVPLAMSLSIGYYFAKPGINIVKTLLH